MSSPYFWHKTGFIVVVIGIPVLFVLFELGWFIAKAGVVKQTGGRLKAVWSNDGPTYGSTVPADPIDPSDDATGK